MANPTYAVGDIVRMKKAHPCGSHEWEICASAWIFGLNARAAAISS